MNVATANKHWDQMSSAERKRSILLHREDGLSSTQIAAIHGCSRNAVVGYMKRMQDAGIKVSGCFNGRRSTKSRSLEAKRPKRPPAKRSAPVKVDPEPVEPVTDPMPATMDERFRPLPGVEPIHITSITEHTCKWPVNGVYGREPIYCGKSCRIETPYCDTHTAWSRQTREVA